MSVGMDAAIAMAKTGEHKFKVGSAILKGRRIIGLGVNKDKTTPFIRREIDRYTMCNKLHGEMAAIINAKMDVVGCKMYVARFTSNGTLMSRPCDLCMRLIKGAGIKEVFYTTGNPLQPWMKEKISYE